MKVAMEVAPVEKFTKSSSKYFEAELCNYKFY